MNAHVKAKELETIMVMLTQMAPPNISKNKLNEFVELNLKQDFGCIVPNLPYQFESKRTIHGVHPENTNQIGIYFNGQISKEIKSKRNAPIASVGLYFLPGQNNDSLYITGIQGELTEHKSHYSRREIKKTYGKLNSFFEEDWRVGISKQVVEFGRKNNINVNARIPGIFSFGLTNSKKEFPIYFLNYMLTYSKNGLKLENIILPELPDQRLREGVWMIYSLMKNSNRTYASNYLKKCSKKYLKKYSQLKLEYNSSSGILTSREFEERCLDNFLEICYNSL